MIIKACKNSPQIQILCLLLFSLIAWAMPFIKTSFSDISIYFQWALVLAESIFISIVLFRQKLSKNPCMVGLAYLLMRTSLYGVGPDVSLWWLPFLLLVSFSYFLKMYGTCLSLSYLFNGVFLWSLASIWSPALIYTLPCFFLVLFIYSISQHKAYLATLVGLILPYIGLWVYDFLFNTEFLSELFVQLSSLKMWLAFPLGGLTFSFLVYSVILGWVGWFFLRKNPIEGEFPQRKKGVIISTFFVYFVILVFAGSNLSHQTESMTYILPFLFPASFLISELFMRKKETLLSESLFIIWVCLALACTFYIM